MHATTTLDDLVQMTQSSVFCGLRKCRPKNESLRSSAHWFFYYFLATLVTFLNAIL